MVFTEELLVAAANGFLSQLRDGGAAQRADLAALPAAVVVEPDDRIQTVTRAVAQLGALGCAAPLRDAEIADPDTGQVLCVDEAWWPEGLQPGLGAPVVLELDPDDANLPRMEELGYSVFISVDALVGFAAREFDGGGSGALDGSSGG